MSARRAEPPCKAVAKFVAAHAGVRAPFAPCTGQDYAAWRAFVHLLELYAFSDEAGRRCAIVAMHHCVMASQESAWSLFKGAIAGVLDWGDEDPLWRKILEVDARAVAGLETVASIAADDVGGRARADVGDVDVKAHPKNDAEWFRCEDESCAGCAARDERYRAALLSRGRR